MGSAAARDQLNGLIMKAYVDVCKARDRATEIGEVGTEEDLFQLGLELQRIASHLYSRGPRSRYERARGQLMLGGGREAARDEGGRRSA